MSYGSVQMVTDRAGGMLAGLSETSIPSTDQISRFLDAASARMDGHLRARGLTLPLTDADSLAAADDLATDGALELALAAKYPNATDDSRLRLLDDAQARFRAGLIALVDGTSPIIGPVEGEGASELPSSLTTTEPDYAPDMVASHAGLSVWLRPEVYKGMQL